MHKTTKSKRRSATEWAKLVRAWQRSGEGAASFARKRGLKSTTLEWWRWKLAQTAVSSRPARSEHRRRPRHARGDAGTQATPRLVAVAVQAAPPNPDSQWEIENARGDVLRVRSCIEPAILDRILHRMLTDATS